MTNQSKVPVSTQKKLRPNLLLAILCVAQFMLVLDVSVTNVALASVQKDLGFAATDLQWIVTAYTLPLASLLIFFGRVGDLFGRRRLFIAGLILFTLASLACGLVQDAAQLVIARATQGVGGAMLSPAALSLLTGTFSEGTARNRALSIWGAVAAGGAAAGMIIGGVLTDLVGWRWVFLINVPIGLLVLCLTPIVVPASRGTRGRLDLLGAVTISGGLVALVYGLTRIVPEGLWSSTVGACLAVSTILLFAFIVVQLRTAEPLVDLPIFRNRSVSAANVYNLFSAAIIVSQSFFLSLYLQQVLGWSPLSTGFALVPITVVVVIVAMFVPRFLPRIGMRTTLVLGGVLLACGMLLHARMPVNGSYLVDVLPAILITAAGLGIGLVAVTIAATSGVEQSKQGLASGILTTTQQIGGAVGLAALATVAGATSGSNGSISNELLTAGYSAAYLVAAIFALAASVTAFLLLPKTNLRNNDSV